ncbi:MAG: endonuclease III [Methanomicrobium sp.]|nr:endonuclease III [Methanomicrobium sp.]
MQTDDAFRIYLALRKIYLKEDTNLCFLEFENPFQILIMTILSAQTTDKNVNSVKNALFSKYPDCKSLASADILEVEEIIKSTGFYHAKAKHIISASQMLSENYGCFVPKTIDELVKLPGVGRKTANIVLNHAYGINEGIAVDTHVKRLSVRLGFTKNNDPDKIETDLKSLFKESVWGEINFLLISHGRLVCKAKNPSCAVCKIKKMCRYYQNESKLKKNNT